MPSTYSGNLAIELIGTGDQAGTWGSTTNTNLGTAVEQAITATASVTFISGGNSAIALTQTNAFQTARSARLNLTGAMSATQYLYVPAISKFYVINNPLTNVVIVSNGANGAATGTTVSIPPGTTTLVYNDGTNIISPINYLPSLANVTLTASTANAMVLSNVSIVSGNANNITSNASTFSNVTIVSGSANGVTISNATITSNATTLTNATITTATVNGGTANGVTESNVTIVSGVVGNTTINAYTENVISVGNTGNAVTINIANATIVTATLTANCTFTMPGNTAGKSFVLLLNTGNGSFTGTFTGVRWNNGNTAPTITTTNNRVDILTFIANGSAWYGTASQNYVP